MTVGVIDWTRVGIDVAKGAAVVVVVVAACVLIVVISNRYHRGSALGAGRQAAEDDQEAADHAATHPSRQPVVRQSTEAVTPPRPPRVHARREDETLLDAYARAAGEAEGRCAEAEQQLTEERDRRILAEETVTQLRVDLVDSWADRRALQEALVDAGLLPPGPPLDPPQARPLGQALAPYGRRPA